MYMEFKWQEIIRTDGRTGVTTIYPSNENLTREFQKYRTTQIQPSLILNAHSLNKANLRVGPGFFLNSFLITPFHKSIFSTPNLDKIYRYKQECYWGFWWGYTCLIDQSDTFPYIPLGQRKRLFGIQRILKLALCFQ